MQDMFSQGAVLIFGATGGIGQHVVMEFAKAGADLALIWRSKEDVAKDIAAQVEALGRKVLFIIVMSPKMALRHEQLLRQRRRMVVSTHLFGGGAAC